MTGIPTATVAKLDEEYIARMEDVLELYEQRSRRARAGGLHRREAGGAARGYAASGHRCGRDGLHGATTNTSAAEPPTCFAASSPRRDGTSPRSRRRARSPEFADYLLEIAVRYPAADTIHLVMDNLSTHTRKALVDRFGEKVGAHGCGTGLPSTTRPNTEAG